MGKAFLADFHVHTTFSDGLHSVAEIVDLYGRLGFGAIAITDHICEEKSLMGVAALHLQKSLTEDSFPKYMETLLSEAERAWHQYNMVLIPGFELSKNSLLNHRSAHILGLGVQEFVSADQDVQTLTREVRNQGALTIAAHPVWTRRFEKQTYHLWDNREELRKEFDAWEVASGQHLFLEVQASGLPVVATGDVHSAEQIYSWKTVLSCERHPNAILDAIRTQKVGIFNFQKPQVVADVMYA